jgi:integrase
MARSIRNSTLETRANRLKLPITSKPVYVKIGPSTSLGYRRNSTAGKWVLRLANGKGGMTTQSIANADDYDESNKQSILTFYEAQDTARRLATRPTMVKPLTVQDATDNYLTVLRSKNAHTEYDTKLRLQKHFLPSFGDKLVSSLTKTQLEKWLAGLVVKSDEPEVVRRSKDTANRLLTMAKALLNHAVADQANNLTDTAWRMVKPFKSVGQPRSIRYSNEEALRIIACAPDKATANLIEAAYHTGTRYGEITSAKVASLDLAKRDWTVTGKTGSRTIKLQRTAVEFFRDMIEGKAASEFIFTMENGQPWKASDQTRPFKAALKAAGLPTDGSLYALRHTYISRAIEAGIGPITIAKNCGTSVRMIEKTYAHLLAENERAFIDLLDG